MGSLKLRHGNDLLAIDYLWDCDVHKRSMVDCYNRTNASSERERPARNHCGRRSSSRSWLCAARLNDLRIESIITIEREHQVHLDVRDLPAAVEAGQAEPPNPKAET
ncbi:hypothetical protein pipiens_008746 [Culex pipiens pipiens]